MGNSNWQLKYGYNSSCNFLLDSFTTVAPLNLLYFSSANNISLIKTHLGASFGLSITFVWLIRSTSICPLVIAFFKDFIFSLPYPATLTSRIESLWTRYFWMVLSNYSVECSSFHLEYEYNFIFSVTEQILSKTSFSIFW